jgi:deoxyribodipyrimidine photolyase-related protein
MKTLILLPNQLYDLKEFKLDYKKLYIILHEKYIDRYKYNKNRLIFMFACIYAFTDEYKLTIIDKLNKIPITEDIIYFDPTDIEIDNEIQKRFKKIEKLDSPNFLFTIDELNEYIKNKPKGKNNNYFNAPFYKWAREKLDVLMKNGKPEGSSYSFDTENRLTFESKYEEPKIKLFKNKYYTKAEKYVEDNYLTNPGEFTPFLPITRKEAEKFFQEFLKKKLSNFGPYEDAIREDVIIGYHSALSALINIGLLNPKEIIDKTIKYYNTHSIKIQSVEGFIRQIISWREYVRMLYIKEHSKFISMNFFKHKRKITDIWYTGNTQIYPIDVMIKKALKYGYLHHIERLMLAANFMLITRLNPKDCYDWFISIVSIDAYEWVMEPNVYGMGLHSVGTLMMNRPYFSSSNYIQKMSSYKSKSGEKIKLGNDEYTWDEVFDALYYSFISDNQTYLSKIYSTASSVYRMKKIPKKEFDKIKDITKKYLAKY